MAGETPVGKCSLLFKRVFLIITKNNMNNFPCENKPHVVSVAKIFSRLIIIDNAFSVNDVSAIAAPIFSYVIFDC